MLVDNKNDNDNQNDENIAYNDDNNKLPLPRCLLTRLECSCQTTLMETPSLFSLFLIVFQKPIEWVVSFWYCNRAIMTLQPEGFSVIQDIIISGIVARIMRSLPNNLPNDDTSHDIDHNHHDGISP